MTLTIKSLDLLRQNYDIPYIEVRMPIRYLEKITLGPCTDAENLMRVLEMMRITYGMNFQINISENPYREY